jgi:hypothetical protein
LPGAGIVEVPVGGDISRLIGGESVDLMVGESSGLMEGRIVGELDASDIGSLVGDIAGEPLPPKPSSSLLSRGTGLVLASSGGGSLGGSKLEMMGEMEYGSAWLLLRSISTKVGNVLSTAGAGERNIRLGELTGCKLGVEAVEPGVPTTPRYGDCEGGKERRSNPVL